MVIPCICNTTAHVCNKSHQTCNKSLELVPKLRGADLQHYGIVFLDENSRKCYNVSSWGKQFPQSDLSDYYTHGDRKGDLGS